mmetsp:Transcript_122914/g.213258  ORF Transcript_122914/g.213258 Transcript_122914/m.213258 type:complete len:159 (+) Transcript_122914:74-550(+)
MTKLAVAQAALSSSGILRFFLPAVLSSVACGHVVHSPHQATAEGALLRRERQIDAEDAWHHKPAGNVSSSDGSKNAMLRLAGGHHAFNASKNISAVGCINIDGRTSIGSDPCTKHMDKCLLSYRLMGHGTDVQLCVEVGQECEPEHGGCPCPCSVHSP